MRSLSRAASMKRDFIEEQQSERANVRGMAIPRRDAAITGIDRDKRAGCGDAAFSLDRNGIRV